jgi:microcystin-dependent protein
MGSTGAGSIGGSTSSDHTHTTGSFTLTANEIPSHVHTYNTYINGVTAAGDARNNYSALSSASTGAIGGGASHNHGNTGAASATENRPLFLSCHYIMKVV